MFKSLTMKLATLCIAMLALSGCVKAVTSTVGMAAGVGTTAVKTTASVAGAGVNAAISNKEDHAPDHADDNPRPFDETRNAMMDVDAALASAGISGKRVLLVLGGNWCHDSRGLAGKFEAELAAVIADYYELVWVDVGHRDRNLNVVMRFGISQIFGTPTVLILSSEGDLLNEESVHDWQTADSKPYDETLGYFMRFAQGEG
ncbi:MAG: thioredoxin family protein [Alphaproteobacteria bacterium]|nr:thioredoxin family protein [Alphaproteobacteria bacterium]